MKEAGLISTLLSDNWNSANTGNVTPIIDLITNRKDINVSKNHFILTYNSNNGSHVFSGMATQDHVFVISIDIRSVVETKFNLFCDEVRRIIKANYFLPVTDYHRLHLERDQDLSDRSRGMYRRVIDVVLRQDIEEF